jgi:hypothetical protein
MKSVGVHRLVRVSVLLVLLLSAVPTLDDAANPQHFDTARAFLSGSVWVAKPTTLHDMGGADGRYFAPFPPLAAVVAIPAILSPWPDLFFNLSVVVAALLAVVLVSEIGDQWGGEGVGTWAAVALGLGSGLWTATVLHDTYHSGQVFAVLGVTASIVLATGRRRHPVASGFALGLATLARQAVVLAAVPLAFLARQRRTGVDRRHAFLAVLLAAAIPVVLYLALNVARFHSPFETGYHDVRHHSSLAADIEKHGTFSIVYLPRNLSLMSLGVPTFISRPPFVVPNPAGMSILLISPWLIFALVPLIWPDRAPARSVAAWCCLAAVAISVPHLLYVNTGWVQFGYRFALDWLPFMLLAAILGIRNLPARLSLPPLAAAVVVNAWGVVAIANWERWSAIVQ